MYPSNDFKVLKRKLLWRLEILTKLCHGCCVGALLVTGKPLDTEAHTCMSPHFQDLNLYCLVLWQRIVYKEL